MTENEIKTIYVAVGGQEFDDKEEVTRYQRLLQHTDCWNGMAKEEIRYFLVQHARTLHDVFTTYVED
jgi:hypothetical protein